MRRSWARFAIGRGRLGELVEQIAQVAREPDSLPAWRAFAAIALIESGREAEPRELALAEDFQSVPWDMIWAAVLMSLADV